MTARREQFEAWARSRGFDLDREPDGGWDNYANRGVQIAWEAWGVALDSVVVKIPHNGNDKYWTDAPPPSPRITVIQSEFNGAAYMCDLLDALDEAGVKVEL